MKKIRKRIAAAASAMLLALCAVPCTAGAATIGTLAPEAVSAEARITYVSFDSIEAAGDYVREQMKQHTKELHIRLTERSGSKNILNDVLGAAFAETGRGDEGDYLRLAIEGYSSYTDYIRRDQVMDIVFYYNSTVEQEAAAVKKMEEIRSSLELDGKDEYQKIKAIYDYLTTNVEYAADEDMDKKEVYTAYGAVVDNYAVCQGIIQSMYRMLMDSGISCRAITGKGNGGDHVWCAAKIGDIYYLLDPTWDSQFDGRVKYFFLRGTEDFDEFCYPIVHVPGTGDPENYAFVPDCTSDSFKAACPISDYAFDVENYYGTFIAGDLNYDGCIDVFDLISAKKCLISGFVNDRIKIAADVNSDGEANISDAVLIQKFIEGSIKDFSKAS